MMPDWLLLLVTSILVFIGLSMILSASAGVSLEEHGHSYHFFWKQLLWAAVGFLGLAAAYFIDYGLYRRMALLLLGFSCLLLALVLVPGIGSESGGVQRWFRVGMVSFQPSEMAKLSAVIFLAAAVSSPRIRISEFRSGLLPPLMMVGSICFLVLLEPDLGSALCIGAVSMILLYLGGARLNHLFLVVVATMPVFVVSILSEPYQKKRLMAFLDPWKDPSDSGFQIIQSMVALGHGGLKGLGLGDGWQKLFFLPAAHTDFVLAVIGEELGFLGILVVILLFGLFWWRGMRIALKAPDTFGQALAMGITVMIILQAAVNAGVVVGLLPTKGLPMPFLSYGGTSLAVNLFSVGILLNISHRCPES
jgi:cell division protein FtsW